MLLVAGVSVAAAVGLGRRPSREACVVGLSVQACGVFGASVRATRPGSFGLDRVTSLPSVDGVGPALRVTYPKGSASPTSSRAEGSPGGGAQLYLALDGGGTDAAVLRYDVRFPRGFEFGKGGKLPGLYGGTPGADGHIAASGGRIPDGTNGLSTRLMWRTGGAGEVYAYLPSSVTHGTSLGRGDWHWQTGVWHRVEQDVRLNHVGSADGSIRVVVDGRQVLDVPGLTFRTVASLRIEGLFFSTFFGGSDHTWASPTDQSVDFAGFDLRRIRSR